MKVEVSDGEKEKWRNECWRRFGGQKERRENAVVDMPVAFGKNLKGLQTLPLCVCVHVIGWLGFCGWFFWLLRMARRCLDLCVCVCVNTVTRVSVCMWRLRSRVRTDIQSLLWSVSCNFVKIFCDPSYSVGPCSNADHMRPDSCVLGWWGHKQLRWCHF